MCIYTLLSLYQLSLSAKINQSNTRSNKAGFGFKRIFILNDLVYTFSRCFRRQCYFQFKKPIGNNSCLTCL